MGKFTETIAKLLFYQMLVAVKVRREGGRGGRREGGREGGMEGEREEGRREGGRAREKIFIISFFQYLHDKGITHRDLKVSILQCASVYY